MKLIIISCVPSSVISIGFSQCVLSKYDGIKHNIKYFQFESIIFNYFEFFHNYLLQLNYRFSNSPWLVHHFKGFEISVSMVSVEFNFPSVWFVGFFHSSWLKTKAKKELTSSIWSKFIWMVFRTECYWLNEFHYTICCGPVSNRNELHEY